MRSRLLKVHDRRLLLQRVVYFADPADLDGESSNKSRVSSSSRRCRCTSIEGARLPEPLFLSTIPLRFRVTDIAQRIHLPVLFGPWSYNHYRTPDVFADIVPVRLTVRDAAQTYHLPLLCSPWSFGTCRGS